MESESIFESKDVKACFENMLKTFVRVKPVTWLGENDPEPSSYTCKVIGDGLEIYLLADDVVVDYEAEKARLSKEMRESTECLEKIRKNLSNENFVTRAPREVVDREYAREKNLAELVERISVELNRIESF